MNGNKERDFSLHKKQDAAKQHPVFCISKIMVIDLEIL